MFELYTELLSKITFKDAYLLGLGSIIIPYLEDQIKETPIVDDKVDLTIVGSTEASKFLGLSIPSLHSINIDQLVYQSISGVRIYFKNDLKRFKKELSLNQPYFKLIGSEEVADHLKVSIRQVNILASLDKLNAKFISNVNVYFEDEVLELVRSGLKTK